MNSLYSNYKNWESINEEVIENLEIKLIRFFNILSYLFRKKWRPKIASNLVRLKLILNVGIYISIKMIKNILEILLAPNIIYKSIDPHHRIEMYSNIEYSNNLMHSRLSGSDLSRS